MIERWKNEFNYQLEIQRLNYTKSNFNHEQNEFFLLSIRINNQQKGTKKSGFGAANFDIERMHNVSENGLGLAQNLMHLNYPAGNAISLKNEQNEIDILQNYIYTYYRKETENFIEEMNNHYSSQIEDYSVLFYIFEGFKLFLYFIFIFRMYSAISVLNKVKISFEEYSRSKRGFLLFMLFVALTVSTFLRFRFFNEFGNNTLSTISLSTVLMNRFADIQYASGYIFESIHFGSTKIYGYNEVMQNILTKVENNDDKIFKTIKGSQNKLSDHFSFFSSELQRLQQQYSCKSYFDFQFQMDDCAEFCKTELKFFDVNKQPIQKISQKEYDQYKGENKFACALPKNDLGQQGILNSIKGLKQQIRQIRDDWGGAQVNDSQDSQENKNAKKFEFMEKHYMKFPESSLYNVRIHNDYLLKLLSKSYQDYQGQFDSYIYLYIFLDLMVVTLFMIMWVFYYLYMIKGLSKHKSKFEELKVGQED